MNMYAKDMVVTKLHFNCLFCSKLGPAERCFTARFQGIIAFRTSVYEARVSIIYKCIINESLNKGSMYLR